VFDDTTLGEPTPESLQQFYQKRLDKFDRRAGRFKLWHQWLGMSAAVFTWATLLVAIIGLVLPDEPDVSAFLLYGLIPFFGILVTLATVVHTVLGAQGRWLRYRAGAERLREACMLFKAGLPPFDSDKADWEFQEKIHDISDVALNKKGRQFSDRFSWWYYLRLVHLPAELRGDLPHTPDQDVFPRFGGDFAQDEKAALDGRLRQQRKWHIKKARGYCRCFLLFQAVIAGIAAVNSVYPYIWGRAFEVVAMTSTVSLMVAGFRDFLGFSSLFQRYIKVAGNLGEIESAYVNREGLFGPELTEYERLRRLVEYTEQTLSSEFQYWYASRH
jgi:hypothetical protein